MEKYNLENFKEEIDINKNKLDIENEKHPSLCHYYEEILADFKGEKDDITKKLDFVKSETELKIRTGGYKNEEMDLKDIKLTEGTIKSLVMVDEKVNNCINKLNTVKKEIYHLEAITKSIEHRKSNLRNLTRLYATAYFSRPDDNIRKKDDNLEQRKQTIRRNNYE